MPFGDKIEIPEETRKLLLPLWEASQEARVAYEMAGQVAVRKHRSLWDAVCELFPDLPHDRSHTIDGTCRNIVAGPRDGLLDEAICRYLEDRS